MSQPFQRAHHLHRLRLTVNTVWIFHLARQTRQPKRRKKTQQQQQKSEKEKQNAPKKKEQFFLSKQF